MPTAEYAVRCDFSEEGSGRAGGVPRINSINNNPQVCASPLAK